MLEVTLGIASGVVANAVKDLIETYIEKRTSEQRRLAIESDDTDALPPDVKLETQTAVGRFATRSAGFSDRVSEGMISLQRYLRKDSPKRPLNLLLAAPPGSGKSFLVEEIVNELNSAKHDTEDEKLNFHELFIPSLATRDEIATMLHEYCVEKEPNTVPVVLFDEIDAEIDGGHMYSNFLSPMWSGRFGHDGQSNEVGKAIFFFAGGTLSAETHSNRIVEEASKYTQNDTLSYEIYLERWLEEFGNYVRDPINVAAKLPDFIDRIDLVLRIPPVTKVLLGSDALNELMDVAAVIVRKNFPSVVKIEQRVLVALAHVLLKANSRRVAEIVIFGSELSEPDSFHFTDLRQSDRRTLEKEMKEYESDKRNPDLKGYFLI